VLSGVSSFWNTWQLNEDAGWVAHTHEVLDGLEELKTALTDAETGQRGYVLTGDPHFREPYDKAVAIIPEKTDRFEELTSDTPRQQERFPRLRRLISAKLAELQSGIDLTRAGNAPGAVAVVKTRKGKLLMEEIRELLAEMRQEEHALLAV